MTASSAPIDYVPIRVQDLEGQDPVDFDVFLQLGGKYVLYVRKGAAFDASKAEKMREKNVTSVFLRADDGARFKREAELAITRRVEQAYDPASKLSVAERGRILQREQESNADALIADPGGVAEYERAREGARRFVDFLLHQPQTLPSILNASSETSLAAHGVRVATIAVGIAIELGMSEMKDLHLLALGCLVHDCGHLNSSVPIESRVSELAPPQLKIFREHTMRGARAAQELAHFDQQVLKIILEHEELIDGSGYPKGLNERQMHIYSIIASSANTYDRLVAFEKCGYQEACKRLVIEKIGRHPLDHINALKKIAQRINAAHNSAA